MSKARSFGRLDIGGAGPGGIASFQGAIAEFRIWNRARSPLELRGTQYQRLSGREPGLLLYLPFDEGQGEIVTNWAIATGRDYNGVLFNSPQWSKQESSPCASISPVHDTPSFLLQTTGAGLAVAG